MQRKFVRAAIKRVDPQGVEQRRQLCQKRIKRRIYSNPHPHFLWHIDSNHKLIRWKMVIYLAIDGFSKMIAYAHCCDNNKAQTVLNLLVSTVAELKLLPRYIRTDLGVENTMLWELMGDNYITGASVHNQRVERLNRDVNINIRNRFAQVFYDLEHQGILDVDNPLDIAVLQCVCSTNK